MRLATLGFILAAATSPSQIPLDWTPVVPPPGGPGTILCQAVFDDGSGPAVYLGGLISQVSGGATGKLARWAGSQLAALDVPTSGFVTALAVWDDGSGPALYIGVTLTGAVPDGTRLFRYDGTTVTPLPGAFDGSVAALASFDAGGGSRLFAGGDFERIDGATHAGIAAWDGSQWAPVGGGVGPVFFSPSSGSSVSALHVWDGGSGAALYAGGRFMTAGGAAASNIARWNGSVWSALGSGLSGSTGSVLALGHWGTGGGSALFAGGFFTQAGSLNVNRIARWNGSTWSALGSGVAATSGSSLAHVRAIEVFDDGGGEQVYVGGRISTVGGVAVEDVARWSGSAWSPVGAGVDSTQFEAPEVSVLRAVNLSGSPELVVGGRFTRAGGLPADSLALFAGGGWSSPGGVFAGLDHANVDGIYSAVEWDDGSGPALWLAGDFTTIGGVAAPNVARWDAQGFSPVGDPPGRLTSMALVDSGTGPTLHVTTYDDVLRWDGATWSPLTAPDPALVRWGHLVMFDDGTGPRLHALATIPFVGQRVVRWTGSSWAPLPTPTLDDHGIEAVVVHDGKLWVGGAHASGCPFEPGFVASWDGTAWTMTPPLTTSFSGGVGGNVLALGVADTGSGPELYAGGSFVDQANLVRWTGSTWATVGGGTNGIVTALVAHDDGGGEQLHAIGFFTTPGPGRARWSGAAWSLPPNAPSGPLTLIASLDDGGGRDLHLVGDLAPAGGDALATIWTSSSCLDGTVGASVGPGEPVIAIGIGTAPPTSARSHAITVGTPWTLGVVQPGVTAAPAGFVLLAASGEPTAATRTSTPLGELCILLPPASVVLVSAPPVVPALAGAFPAPSSLAVPGLPAPLVATIQGIIQDDSAPFGWSVTDGTVIRIVP